MNQDQLNTFFDKLIETLIKDLVFYIPKAIIPKTVIEQLGDQIPAHFLDEISILDLYGGFGEFEMEEFNERYLDKQRQLEQNIFQLLRKKKELETFEFDYILEKYFDQVEFYLFITGWLNTNLKTYLKDEIDFAIVGAFGLQFNQYENHGKTLVKHFYDPKKIVLRESFNVLELLQTYLPELTARYGITRERPQSDQQKEQPEPEQNNSGPDIKDSQKNIDKEIELKKNTKKEKKPPVITELEAEEFLLTNVFNA